MNITLCNIDYDLTQFLYLEKELVILYILYKEGKYIMLDEKFMGRVTAMYKYQREPENLTSDEAAIINYATEFFQTHKVSTPTFNSALEQFGSQHLVEITALIGHYTQTSMILNTFEVTLPEDRTEVVLPI